MNAELGGLAALIRRELNELERVLHRVEAAWKQSRQVADDYYLDSVALNLHGFYGGLERIFGRIATTVDGSLPQGANWHQALLAQMAREVPGVRPAVISTDTHARLDEYRGFRHVVRNVYTYHFDPERLAKLVGGAGPLFQQAQAELIAFAAFLEEVDE